MAAEGFDVVLSEEHTGASDNEAATFKWSRDNSSYALPVVAVDAGGRVITVSRQAGRDLELAPGDWVELDTSQVESLADMTGGRFFAARDDAAIADVYAEINELERVEFEEARFQIEERFLAFLVGAVVLLVLARLLDSTVLEVLP